MTCLEKMVNGTGGSRLVGAMLEDGGWDRTGIFEGRCFIAGRPLNWGDRPAKRRLVFLCGAIVQMGRGAM